MFKVLVSDPVSEQGVALLQEQFQVDVKTKLPVEELIRIIPEYDALVVRSETKVTAPVLDAAAKLKVIGRAGVGVDNIDVEHATKKGVIVLNAPEGNTMAATEHSVAMMLSLARNIPQAHASMQAGKWERGKFMGVELRGKTLGILGLGRIGTGVAKRALALEMRVLAYDPFINVEAAQALGIEVADMDDIFAQADFITLHLPKTNQTKNLINKETFAKMKKGVRIVNCARGGVINEADLAAAVQEGIVAGAAVDVFESEPIQEGNPLVGLPQVIVTPHLGASTVEAQVGVAVDVAHGIVAALKGEPVTTAVNMAAIPAHVLKKLRPYLNLAERMGCLAVHLADGRMTAIEIEYNGDIGDVDTRMLTTGILKGCLNPILQESINYVNAPGLAKARNIEVKEIKTKAPANFANLITVRLVTDKGEHTVSGTLFGKAEARIVNIDGYRVDVQPGGWLLTCPHVNRPGIIGSVGTVLGQAGVNIASMQVGLTEVHNTSIMALGVDSEVPNDVLAKLKDIDGIYDAKLINFDAR